MRISPTCVVEATALFLEENGVTDNRSRHGALLHVPVGDGNNNTHSIV